MPVLLSKEVNEFLANARSLRKDIFRNSYYPTQASAVLDIANKPIVVGKCARQIFYWAKGLEPTDHESYNYVRRLTYGKEIELAEIETYKRMGIFVDSAVKFVIPIPNTDAYISGEIDAVVKLDGYLVGVEYKTGYGNSFVRQHITGYTSKNSKTGLVYTTNPQSPAPKIEHLMQTALYLHAYRYEIPYWKLIYTARDTMDTAEYDVYLENDGTITCYSVIYNPFENRAEYQMVPLVKLTIKDIFDRFVYVHNHVTGNVVPARDFEKVYSPETGELLYEIGAITTKEYEKILDGQSDKGDWQCSYCPYRSLCDRSPDQAHQFDVYHRNV